jgi:hypothetical protein
MSEVIEQTGVESVPVAGEQAEGATMAAEGAETTQTIEEDAANTENAPQEAAEGSETIQNEKDFAAALRARERQLQEKYEREYTPYRETASKFEQIAKALGYDSGESYLQALESHAREQEALRQAEQLGLDLETYQQFFAPVHEELNRTKQELQQLRQAEIERQIRADYERLKSTYDDFEKVQDRVFEIAATRNLPLEDAYKLATFDEKIQAAKLAGQAEAVEAIRANAQSSPGPAGGDAPENRFDFTKLSREERQKLYERAKRGELRSLQ